MIWVETEQFADPGGWTCDSQFIDQMGSPYLLAVGLGHPVADARTTVTVPVAGQYRLWVRSRDWSPAHHPGSFQLLLDGAVAGGTFGANGQEGWQWEDGGVVTLPQKSVALTLRDLSGYYGRCDVIALCADLEWTPPSAQSEIAALRACYGGVSATVEEGGAFDVVVVGGGLAGCVAAVAAARLGVRVALLQNRSLLGGNASTEILVPPVGSWPHGEQDPLDPHETGLVDEFRTEGKQRTEETRFYSRRLHRLVTAEPNLTLCLDTHVTEVQSEGGQIRAVQTLEVPGGRRRRFVGQTFIDCTGDATVGVAGGADYCQGREPRSLYNESLAPDRADSTTMGNSLKYYSLPTPEPHDFVAPAWAMPFLHCKSFPPRRHPHAPEKGIDWQWILELGGTRDTYRDKEEIRDDLLRLIYGIWDHVKNHCDTLREAASNHRLAWVGHVCGMRESRRLMGDHVLTENDVADQVLFPDRIAYGGWGLDDHYSEGFLHKGEPSVHPYKGLLHSVPYRCLYSRNVSNLLMAGRNLSASHVGMGSTRVMLTCAVIAQAVGTAAALCVRLKTTPRGIYENHLEQLQQQLLKDGAFLIGLPNRDERDLARQATMVRASSAARFGKNGETLSASLVVNGVARKEGDQINAWAPDPESAAPHWIELGWDTPQSFNTVHLTFQTRNLAPRHFRIDIRQAKQGNEAWQTIVEDTNNRFGRRALALPHGVTTDRLRVVLPSEAVGICEIRVYDEPEETVETLRRAEQTMHLTDEAQLFPWGTDTARHETEAVGESLDATNGFLGLKQP